MLAGALLGLLIFKPQIALLLPVAVLAGRRWKTTATAAVVVIAVIGLSVLDFGLDSWRGFFGPTLQMQGAMLQHGRGPFMWMMPSAYMSGRIYGLPTPWALLVQAPFTLMAAVLVGWAWRRDDSPLELRAAILMMGTFVASPQAFNYDLAPAGAAALVLLQRDRIAPLGLALAFMVWGAPVVMMALERFHAPVTPLVLAAALIRLAMLPKEARAGADPAPA